MTTDDGVRFAKIAIPVPLGQAFTYEIPSKLIATVSRGARVLCDFGRRRVLGVVLEVTAELSGVERERVRPLLAVVDSEPPVPEELLGFLCELARYYLAPIGEVVRLALPAVERAQLIELEERGLFDGLSVAAVGRLVNYAVAIRGREALSNPDGPKLKGQALSIFTLLIESGPTPVASLSETYKNARSAVQRLAQLELVRIEKRPAPAANTELELVSDVPPELTPAQSEAVAAITSALQARDRQAFLLEGVTASGKTEVYLRSVQHCLEQSRGAIVLVPEIALTPQLVARFRARLGDTVAVLHSGLTKAERYRMWRALRSSELKVAVGARSALFAPIGDLALICVDEEHDGSFKQEEGVRYNARDMALLRAYRAGAVSVLGSATPAVSTVALARQKRLTHLRLPARANQQASLPQVRIVDLRRTGAGPSGEALLSIMLHRELEETLKSAEQAILFLNRRGFAPSLICADCGHVYECPNCAVALTAHRGRRDHLRCHYCDLACPLPSQCEACHGPRLLQEGAGTERIEAALKQSFPQAKVARLDRDVAGGTKSERILERMRKGEVDILVGTQMVTKGHDLPKVTLVGVLNADAALSMPDYRASERSFQLLVQVAGRAGRAGRPGRVLIQTRKPEHPAIVLAARHDVNAFAERELADRLELGYPPYGHLALVRIEAVDAALAKAEASRLAERALSAIRSEATVLGPAPAPIARLRNRYRFHFIVRARERKLVRNCLLSILRTPADRRVRVVIDVDPMSML